MKVFHSNRGSDIRLHVESVKHVQIASVNDTTVEHGICIEDAKCDEIPTDNSNMCSSGETVTDR